MTTTTAPVTVQAVAEVTGSLMMTARDVLKAVSKFRNKIEQDIFLNYEFIKFFKIIRNYER